MTRRIYKYEIPLRDYIDISLFRNSKPLSFQVQHDKLMLWVLMGDSQETENRRFKVYGTGQPIFDENITYIGTCQLDGFVWHLFEVEF